jgi:O-antigen/teichoic acid export membrane protein
MLEEYLFDNRKRLINRITQFLGKGVYAIIDQALYAGSNFLISIFMARQLDTYQYGAFSTVYSWFFLVIGFHSAIVIEPMLVFGSGKYLTEFKVYFKSIFRGNLIFSIVVGTIFLIVGLIFTDPIMSATLVGIAIASPFILSQFTIRRSFYSQSLPKYAAIFGFFYIFQSIFGLIILGFLNKITSSTAFLIMGLSSLGVILIFFYKFDFYLLRNSEKQRNKKYLLDHWNYGLWAVLAALFMWFPGNMYYSLLAYWGNIEYSGVLKALMNPILPVQHGLTALATIFIPEISRGIYEGKKWENRRFSIFIFGFIIFVSLINGLILFFFRYEILNFLYDGKYNEYANYLIVVALLPIFTAGNCIFGGILRALQKTKLIFQSYLASTLISVSLGIGIVFFMDLFGTFLAILLGSISTTLMMAYFVIRELRN